MAAEDTSEMVLRTVFLPPDVDACLRNLAFDAATGKNEMIRTLVREALVARGYEMSNGRLVKSEAPQSVAG